MVNALYRDDVVVYRFTSSGVDARGNPTGSWAQVWSGKGSSQPLTGEENRSGGRETQQFRLKVFLPADAVVDDADRLDVNGAWASDSPPGRNIEQVSVWTGHHLEVRVRQEV